MVRQRQSNIELCRILAILCVMFVHTTFQSLGTNVSFGVMLLAGFSIVGVNVFVMLTGYFTATPKKISLLDLAFVCFFWMIVKVICHLQFGECLNYKDFFFITTSNWFVPSYICLLFFTPILNVFCNSVSKKVLWTIVIALLFIEIWFDWLPPSPTISLGTNGGHSVLSFLILYLLARAIRLYGLPTWFKRISPLAYICCSVILGLFGTLLLRGGYEYRVRWAFADNNPVVILSSVAFLMSFESMTIQSNFINHIAKSTLACLLGHTAIYSLYTKQFKFLYANHLGIKMIGFWILAVLIVFCACIAIDQFRLLMWKPIEKCLLNRIKKNELI